MQTYLGLVRQNIQKLLESPSVHQTLELLPSQTRKAFTDYIQRPGRMLRAQFFFLASQSMEQNPHLQNHSEIGAALELFQSFLLIHDDIIDNAQTRRGQPALHQIVGTSNALILGDMLYTLSLMALHRLEVPADQLLNIQKLFLNVALQTGVGQMLDQNETSKTFQDTRQMYLLKTGAYSLKLPLQLAAHLNKREDILVELEKLGSDLGFAYQLLDDLENIYPRTDLENPKDLNIDYSSKKNNLLKVCLEDVLKKSWDFTQPVEVYYKNLRSSGVWSELLQQVHGHLSSAKTLSKQTLGEQAPFTQSIDRFWTPRLERLQ